MLVREDDIFFLLITELIPVAKGDCKIKEIIEKRKKAFEKVSIRFNKDSGYVNCHTY